VTTAERMVSAATTDDESSFDVSLRPTALAEYVGQRAVKDNLEPKSPTLRLQFPGGKLFFPQRKFLKSGVHVSRKNSVLGKRDP